MTTLTHEVGQHRAPVTHRMRRIADPTDTIVLIANLPPVPAPQPRHPGGDSDTRRGAVTTMPRRPVRLTDKGEGFLWALTILVGVGLGWILPRAFFEAVVFLPGF